MIIRTAAAVTCAGVLISAAGHGSVDGESQESVTSAQVVPAWYAVARTAPASPVQLSRVLAMVHAAMHDAVNGADRRYETYASDLTDRRAHPEAAAAAAAHRVLSGLFSAQQDSWDAALADSLSRIGDGPRKKAGIVLGAAVGQVVLDVRANDGWNGVDPFNPPPAPGIWRPTPPAFSPMAEPQFHNVRPFAIVSGNQFPLAPPPRLSDVEYERVFDEVKSLGSDASPRRSDDQTDAVHFWFEPPYDSWSRIAGILAADNRYNLHRTARLYALVNMVSCDGLIAGWYWKRHDAFWRPITAIHEADTDGNSHTAADLSWRPLRTTPLHPDHPSTHSVLGGAAAELIRRFTGSDHHKFCMTTLTAARLAQRAVSRRCPRRRRRTASRGCMPASTFAQPLPPAISSVAESVALRSSTCFARWSNGAATLMIRTPTHDDGVLIPDAEDAKHGGTANDGSKVRDRAAGQGPEDHHRPDRRPPRHRGRRQPARPGVRLFENVARSQTLRM
jgi:hypothetical protein